MAEDIAARFDGYSQAWANLATDGIAGFWAQESFHFYKAEEVAAVFTAFDDLLSYWRGNEGLHEGAELTFTDVQDLGIPGPARLVSCKMDWKIGFRPDATDANGARFRHAGKAMAGWNHVLSLWEEQGGEWCLTGWCEVPDAAPLYLTELYYRMAQ
ncbi:hypothetical protein [Altererythrobacter sp. MF3-039]|uniref:hypothetical protein n=1 Tax=Altererythrobacter sp. MF3-039 TaxID=3252901 RepID=UPI00390C6F08